MPLPNFKEQFPQWGWNWGGYFDEPLESQYDDEGNLTSGAPAYDPFAGIKAQLDAEAITASEYNDLRAYISALNAGEPTYPTNYFAQPTEAQMRAPFEEMFGGSAAGREFIGRKLSDPDFFTGLNTQLGAINAREGLRHPQTIPTDPMSVVSAFPATKAPSLAAEFKQEQEEERARRGELTGAGSTIFKRRTL